MEHLLPLLVLVLAGLALFLSLALMILWGPAAFVVAFRRNIVYTQAYGCWLAIQVGSWAVLFGDLRRDCLLRVELLTPLRWFRVSPSLRTLARRALASNGLLGAGGAALLLIASLVMLGCGSSTSPDAVPTPAPSASPTPGPEKLVVVHVTGVQNGKQGVNDVQANEQFKINATASVCYLDRVEVPCDGPGFAIPYWRQRQTGGELCSYSADQNSSSVAYQCATVGNGRVFEACALDFDKTEIGCGSWTINVN